MGGGLGKLSSKAVARGPPPATNRKLAQEPDPDEELWAMIVEMTQHSSVSSSHPTPSPPPAAAAVPVRFYVFLDSLAAPGAAGTQQAAAGTAPRANQRGRRGATPWVPRRRFAALPPLRGFSDLFKINRKR